MLLSILKSLNSTIVYIQIWKDRIKVSNTNNDLIFDQPAVMAIESSQSKTPIIKAIGNDAIQYQNNKNITLVYPFDHPRIVLGDFEVAEKIILHAMRITFSKHTFFRPSPKIILQSMEYTDELSQIEIRALKELGFGAGGRESVVYQGLPLDLNDLNYNSIKDNCLN